MVTQNCELVAVGERGDRASSSTRSRGKGRITMSCRYVMSQSTAVTQTSKSQIQCRVLRQHYVLTVSCRPACLP